MSKALETIRSEHRNISRVLRCLESELGRLREAERRPNLELLFSILYYIRVFPDRYHHPKEEEYLFAALRRRRPDAAPVLDALRAEHELLADRLEGIEHTLRAYESRFPDGFEPLEHAVRDYLDLQWRHMRTEESEVLPLAEDSLDHKDWERVDRAFERNADPMFGANLQAGFDALYARVTTGSSE